MMKNAMRVPATVLKPFVYSPRRYHELIEWINEYGSETAPRGMKTVEILDAHLIVRNPRDRIIFDPVRKMNIAFAIADWIQVMAGDDSVEFLSHFAERIKDFANPKRPSEIGGAYGPRIRHRIEGIVALLTADPDSRQAIIVVYNPADYNEQSHIIPCTLSLQFLVRHGALEMIANMRSNDAVWGLTYDVFMFTMIQEYIANRLKLPLGEYHHNDGSLHIYEDRDSAMLGSLGNQNPQHVIMEPLDKDIDLSIIGKLWIAALAARDLESRKFWKIIEGASPIARDLAVVLRFWSARKAHDEVEMNSAARELHDTALKMAVELWQ